MPVPAVISTAFIGIVLLLSPLVASSPAEPAWTALFTALIALATALLGAQAARNRAGEKPAARLPEALLFAAAAWGFVSLLWRWLGVEHGRPVYLDALGQGWTYLAALAALPWVTSRLGENRAARYALLFCLVASAGFAGVYGVQDWLVHAKEHAPDWREFSTTTDPDFFAGYLVMAIPVTLALYLGAPTGTTREWGLIRFVFALLILYGLTLPLLFGALRMFSLDVIAVFGLLIVILIGLAALLRTVSVAPFLLGLSLVWQLAALLVTGSRFALVSVAIGIITVALMNMAARRAGMAALPAARQRIVVLVVIALIGGVFVARPILHRLEAGTLKSEANSGAFRIWTWKGAARMAKANPVLGTGPGTFTDLYPSYAVVGFTQLAHDSYLQLADEIGVPGLLLVLAALGLIFLAGVKGTSQVPALPEEEKIAMAPARGSKKTRQAATPSPERTQAEIFLAQAASPDDRLLLAGLVGALAAGLGQNVIDSDIYLFYNGVTLFAIAGLVLALGAKQELPAVKREPHGLVWAGVAIYAAIFIGMAWSGIAALSALSGDYQTAASMAPWNADYAGALGWQVYPSQGRMADAEQELARAENLEPTVKNANRLGEFYLQQGQPAKALAAFDDGLRHNPDDLQLLLNAAQTEERLADKPAALAVYQKMVALQHGPVGQIPAVPEYIPYRFAYADSAVGDQLLAQGDLVNAARNYQEARAMLEAYANAGGSHSEYEQAMSGGQPNPDLDRSLQSLYDHVMTELITINQRVGRTAQAAAWRSREQIFDAKFAAIEAEK